MAPCPLCRHVDCLDEGDILHEQPPQVAGVAIDLRGRTFHLLHCPACGFRFKSPRFSERELLDCYRRASPRHWQLDPDPRERRFDCIAAVLERFAPPTDRMRRRVLDVGCFNGALLASLAPSWAKFGIEPSPVAAAIARGRGVTIAGEAFDECVPAAHFDALLAIDIVEHLVDPLAFFRQAARALRARGVLVVMTGDSEAPSWRWHGKRHWYCGLPEHVSFFSARSLDHAAAQCGFVCVERRRLSHVRAGLRQRSRETAKNAVYGVAQRLGWLPTRELRARVLERPSPRWVTARDHLLAVLRRRA